MPWNYRETLARLRSMGHKCGYGVGDDMDSILAKYTKRKDRPSIVRVPPP